MTTKYDFVCATPGGEAFVYSIWANSEKAARRYMEKSMQSVEIVSCQNPDL